MADPGNGPDQTIDGDAETIPAVAVSVVMPVGRVDDELGEQLLALAGQSYDRPWELVLSLNTSAPDVAGRLEELTGARFGAPWPQVRVVDSSAVPSAAHARNVGADSAQGRLLLFCDGDDIADERWVETMVDALGTADAVGGHLDEELLAIAGQEDWRPPATPGDLPRFLGHPYLVSANMGVTAEGFRRAGGFDVGLLRGEDIAFSWELIDRGLTLAYRADAIVHYRHRRGLGSMMRQHYLYGRGFSQLLANRGVPGEGATTGIRALRPNSQAVDRKGLVYLLRRGSIAVGRVVGLAEHRLLPDRLRERVN